MRINSIAHLHLFIGNYKKSLYEFLKCMNVKKYKIKKSLKLIISKDFEVILWFKFWFDIEFIKKNTILNWKGKRRRRNIMNFFKEEKLFLIKFF